MAVSCRDNAVPTNLQMYSKVALETRKLSFHQPSSDISFSNLSNQSCRRGRLHTLRRARALVPRRWIRLVKTAVLCCITASNRQFPSSRFRIFVDDQMLTISPFSGWDKGNVAQNNNIYNGGTEGKICYMKRGLSKLFLSSRKRRMSTFRSTLKEIKILEYKWKSAKELRAKPSHRKRNSKMKRSNKPFFLVCLMFHNRPANKSNPLRGK